MVIYSRSSIQNTYYRRFWIRKNECIINLISNQPDIDKIYPYGKDQYLINKREKVGLDHFNDPKAFIEYSNDMLDAYKTLKITIQIEKEKY